MFEELNRLAGWSVKSLPEKEVLLITDKGCDGSFLLSHFISMYLKAKQSVILITAAQSQTHYKVVCSKLGVNLEKAEQSKQLVVLDLLKISLDDYMQENDHGSGEWTNLFSDLRNKVFNFIDQMSTADSNILVILDDLSMFCSLGFSMKEVINFFHSMAVLRHSTNATFLTLLHSDNEHQQTEILASCQYYCTSELRIEGLDTGYCKDIHGTLTLVQKRNLNLGTAFNQTLRQFKVKDRTLSLFAPGTSRAVL